MLLDEYTTSGTAIFARILDEAKGPMTKALARHILTLGFSEADQARMLDLAERNQEDRLTKAERREMLSYVEAGHSLALLHAKAHRVLKTPLKKPVKPRRG
jgi:hypothetical protein